MLFIICSLCFHNCFIICYLDRMNNHNDTPCKILEIEPQNFTVWYHSPVSKLFSCTNLLKNTVLDPLHSFINEMTFQAPPNQFAQPIQPKLLLMHWYALIFLAAFLKITDLFIVLMPQINVLILCFYFL